MWVVLLHTPVVCSPTPRELIFSMTLDTFLRLGFIKTSMFGHIEENILRVFFLFMKQNTFNLKDFWRNHPYNIYGTKMSLFKYLFPENYSWLTDISH